MLRLWHDLRFAWRQLRRAPAFAATAVATLALGIGANTGIYGLINGFSRPLAVPDADRIVIVASDAPSDDTGLRYRFSYPALEDYRAQAGAFTDVMAFDTRLGGLTVDHKTAQFLFHVVSGNFFTGLGVVPAVGRVLSPGEGEHLGAEPVVVLGYACWMRRFGGRRDVVGQIVRVDGEPARVIGVVPREFRGLYEGTEMDGYVPLSMLRWSSTRAPEWLFGDRSATYLTMIGRLKPGVGLEEARTAVSAVAKRLETLYPATEKGLGVRVIPEPLARPIPLRFFATMLPVIRALLLMLATLVLLLACLNVTNLLFVRATVRQREMAVRSALGSGRARLIRLLLVESTLLAGAGAAAGLLLSRVASEVFVGSLHLSLDLPITFDLSLDRRMFVYALGTTALTGIAIGILPAWRASRTRVTDLLHDGGRGGSAGAGRQRLRSALVVAQVAGSLVLLVVAGLFVRSLQVAQRIDIGFDPEQVLTLRLDPHQVGYDVDRSIVFYEELERRIRALPGVEHAAFSFSIPMGYMIGGCPLEAEGQPLDALTRPAVAYNSIGTDYFTTLRMPIVRGRAFDVHDVAASAQVAIVNETLATRLWPGQSPLGRRLRVLCFQQANQPWWQVVGVARDSKYIAVFEQPTPYLYLPITQTKPSMRVAQIRSTLPPAELMARVQTEIAGLDPEIPIADVRTMRQAIAGGFGYLLFRVGTLQAAAMGLIGLVLAVVGVYGVVSYGASQRAREIGIRLALGAHPGDVRRLVLRQGARLVIAGVAAGLVVSVAVTRLLTRLLVLVGALDPLTFIVVTAALVTIALVACYLPARRAMRVDPMTALRHE
jgi:predicted permease